MLVQAYKQYKDFLDSRRPRFYFIKKSAAITFTILFVALGAISAFVYYQYNKIEPQIIEAQYLDNLNGSFNTGKQSLEDVLTTFKIAGAKITLVDNLKESSNSASGYSISLDDIDKTISKIDAAREIFQDQKNQIASTNIPLKFHETQNQLVLYFGSGTTLLSDLKTEHRFDRETLLALGPNFYLPILSDKSLWHVGNEQKIISYYQNTKSNVNEALTNLSRLTPPEEFRNYYTLQTSYLELLGKVSDDIINILKNASPSPGPTPSPSPQTEAAVTDTTTNPNGQVTAVEKAYQLLVDADKKNEKLAQDLLNEKLNLFDRKRNLDKFAQVNLIGNSLNDKIAQLYSTQPQINSYQMPAGLLKLLPLYKRLPLFGKI